MAVVYRHGINGTVGYFIPAGDSLTAQPEGGILYTQAGFNPSNSPVGNIFFGVVNSDRALNENERWNDDFFIQQLGDTWYQPGFTTSIALRPSLIEGVTSVLVVRLSGNWNSYYLAYYLDVTENNKKRRYTVGALIEQTSNNNWANLFTATYAPLANLTQSNQAVIKPAPVLPAPVLPAATATLDRILARPTIPGSQGLDYYALPQDVTWKRYTVDNGYKITVTYPQGDNFEVLANGYFRFTKAGLTPSTNPKGNLFLAGLNGPESSNVFGLNLFPKVPHPADKLGIVLDIPAKEPFKVTASWTEATTGLMQNYVYTVELKQTGLKARYYLSQPSGSNTQSTQPVTRVVDPQFGDHYNNQVGQRDPSIYSKLDLPQVPISQGNAVAQLPAPIYQIPEVDNSGPTPAWRFRPALGGVNTVQENYRPETAPVTTTPSALALDFDLTIMNQHIWSHYCSTADGRTNFLAADRARLQSLVAPASLRYLNDLVDKLTTKGIPTVIVSYGSAECILRTVREFFPSLANPNKIYTPSRLGYPDGTDMPDNKVNLIGLFAQEYGIDTARVMLVDDTGKNVDIVKQHYRTPFGLIVDPKTALTEDNFREIYRTFGL